MTLELFAGLPVRDFAAARPWYERLLGSEPSFLPHETEAVWTVEEHRHVYIVEDADTAGGGHVTLFVDDLDARVDAPRRAASSRRSARPTGTACAR